MTKRTWIGGGNNQASNPKDWSPTGTPEPDDQLQILGPAISHVPPQLPTYTMNVAGDDLIGDPLSIERVNATVNVTRGAAMSAQVLLSDATFNLSARSNLGLQVAYDTLSALVPTQTTVNISGSDTMNLQSSMPVTVNVAPGSTWVGSFTLAGSGLPGRLASSGGNHADFVSNGASVIGPFAAAVLALPVSGSGSFGVNGRLEFTSSVGPSQSVQLIGYAGQSNGLLQVDDPKAFRGSVTLAPGLPSDIKQIDLMGLAQADSFSYTNDLLNIWSGNTIIDTLRLTDRTQYGFAVVKTSGSVNVVTLASSGQNLPGALPVHAGT